MCGIVCRPGRRKTRSKTRRKNVGQGILEFDMNLSANQIRFIHAIIFLFLMGCLGFALFSVIRNQITEWTWFALLLILLEGLVLAYFKWQCPLTTWAENRGAENGTVADLFLPKVLADRLFQVCGVVYAITVVLVLIRWFTR